jgi:choline dehydrogenase-like flavoprotein
MDHVFGMGAIGTVPGFLDRYYYGRRPTGIYIPRYANITEKRSSNFVRGYGFQGHGERPSWNRGTDQTGIGVEFKQSLRDPGPWQILLYGFAEMLPRPDNRVTLHATRKDPWGMPLAHIDCTHGENELKLAAQATHDAYDMLLNAGCENVRNLYPELSLPGSSVHEMGTARMGRDPATSVLNGHNQAHDVPNLFITDGACMTSSGCVNPSLTYMALSARAANHAADLLGAGEF